ncbi:MAG: Stk1 family PASTA domain-containing Ser/Thr kinase [Canibacter sp.]
MSYASRDQFLGRTLDDRYRVRSRIARGGMGMVYLADDLRLGRKVAVKIMHPHLVDDDTFVRRFEKEAHAAARLNDQNVVNVFDQGFDGEAPYLVMEYVPGITLRQLLKQQKRLTADQAIEISEAVLSGLSAAHQAGFIHRDVKPENVFLADDGGIKIGDFGLARSASANTTTGQALLGTIAYLSPELVTRGVADARSDVYAFGIMLYEMLTGVQPYRGEQAVQIAYMHAHEDVPAPSQVSSESTPELDELVRWTTARDPEKRPRDATVTLTRMRHLLGTGLAAATRELPQEDHTMVLDSGDTAATTMLREPESTRIARAQSKPPTPPRLPATPLGQLQSVTEKRRSRGRIVAVIIVFLALIIGGTGWWFGQGPGAKVKIPDVAAQEFDAAASTLADLGLTVQPTECHSLDVPEGQAVSTAPESGSRVEPESEVELCRSLGPELLDVPQIVGLEQSEAEKAIVDAGFTFGDVTDTQFSEEAEGIILAAVDENGDALNEQYPEQGTVDVVVSAGTVPAVSGLSQDDATTALADVDLTVDSSGNIESYSDDVSEGLVIGLTESDGPIRPGDAVSLNVSLGPELFQVPDVVGKRMKEAVQILNDAGFETKTDVPDLLQNAVRVSETDPEAGTEAEKGTVVTLGFEL